MEMLNILEYLVGNFLDFEKIWDIVRVIIKIMYYYWNLWKWIDWFMWMFFILIIVVVISYVFKVIFFILWFGKD